MRFRVRTAVRMKETSAGPEVWRSELAAITELESEVREEGKGILVTVSVDAFEPEHARHVALHGIRAAIEDTGIFWTGVAHFMYVQDHADPELWVSGTGHEHRVPE